MERTIRYTESVYERFLETPKDPMAASILSLACSVKELTDEEVEHSLALGIRHGLFGCNAGVNDSISDN